MRGPVGGARVGCCYRWLVGRCACGLDGEREHAARGSRSGTDGLGPRCQRLTGNAATRELWRASGRALGRWVCGRRGWAERWRVRAGPSGERLAGCGARGDGPSGRGVWAGLGLVLGLDGFGVLVSFLFLTQLKSKELKLI